MKREIKFRAWGSEPYDEPKKYHQWEYVKPSFDLWLDDKDFVIEQFTGLKDKNGVEIYEGDVVRWDDNSYGKYWRECKVVWSKSHYKLVGFSYYADKPSRRIPVSFNFGAFLYEYDGALEIIGNIHENPELI